MTTVGDVIRDASDWLREEQKKHVGQKVTYSREGRTADVVATVESTTVEVDDGTGIVFETEVWDFIIDAADLFDEPKRGDAITWVNNGKTHRYDVRPPSGQEAWRWSDSYHRAYRIHTHLEHEAKLR